MSVLSKLRSLAPAAPRLFLVLAVIATIAASPPSGATETERRLGPDVATPLVARVIEPPHPVRGSDHKVHLAYELLILNTTAVPVAVRRIETFDPAHPESVLATLSGQRLAAHMGSVTGASGVRLGPKQSGLVILDVRLDRHAPIPDRLIHRLTVKAASSGSPTEPYTTGTTRVVNEEAVQVAAPLRGARWANVNGCCADASAHRTALLPVNGDLHVAQRFAIDLVRLQPDGRLFTGPIHMLSSYPYYGTPVRSATSGVVVRARDGLPDQVPFEPPSGITVATAPGNHIVVRLGHGRFVMYAHLQPGSLQVSVGDHVTAGQALALLGNSGNSDFPHLHFQIMDSSSPLGSEGLPFVLPSINSPGSVPPIDEIDPTKPIPIGTKLKGHFTQVMPLHRQVLNFAP